MSSLTTSILRPLTIAAVIAAFAFAAPVTGSAAEGGADEKAAHQHDAGNEKCPMCDKKVATTVPKVEFKAEKCQHPELKGAMVAVCSQECGDKLKADPAKHEAQVWNVSKFQRR